MKLPAQAAIIEVLLRDGLQNEARPVPLPVKIDCLHKLLGAGLREIEIGAFVDPRRVPQMAGTFELSLPSSPNWKNGWAAPWAAAPGRFINVQANVPVR